MNFTFRHSSIDAATRAPRGLPEDLICLCVGIEDPHDLLDDLERALIDAGAIAVDASQNKYFRVLDNEALVWGACCCTWRRESHPSSGTGTSYG